MRCRDKGMWRIEVLGEKVVPKYGERVVPKYGEREGGSDEEREEW